jgi:hypothetical protein
MLFGAGQLKNTVILFVFSRCFSPLLFCLIWAKKSLLAKTHRPGMAT